MTADSRSVSPGANCIPAAGSWQVDEPPQPRTETTSGMVLVRPGQLEVAPEASGGVNARTDENVDDHFAKARLRVVTVSPAKRAGGRSVTFFLDPRGSRH